MKQLKGMIVRMKFLTFVTIWFLIGSSLAWVFVRIPAMEQAVFLQNPVSMGSLLALTFGLLRGVKWILTDSI